MVPRDTNIKREAQPTGLVGDLLYHAIFFCPSTHKRFLLLQQHFLRHRSCRSTNSCVRIFQPPPRTGTGGNVRFKLIINASRAMVSNAPFVFSDVLALVSATQTVWGQQKRIHSSKSKKLTNKSTVVLVGSSLAFFRRYHSVRKIDLVAH